MKFHEMGNAEKNLATEALRVLQQLSRQDAETDKVVEAHACGVLRMTLARLEGEAPAADTKAVDLIRKLLKHMF